MYLCQASYLVGWEIWSFKRPVRTVEQTKKLQATVLNAWDAATLIIINANNDKSL